MRRGSAEQAAARAARRAIVPLDGRTREARVMRDALATLTNALAEDLSPQERSLCERIVNLEMLLRADERRLLTGNAAFDRAQYRADINALVGLYRTIGIKRRAKTVRRLHEILQAEATEAPDAS